MVTMPEIIERMREIFVTDDEFHLQFDQVKNLVYGVVGMILIAFVSLVIRFFVK